MTQKEFLTAGKLIKQRQYEHIADIKMCGICLKSVCEQANYLARTAEMPKWNKHSRMRRHPKESPYESIVTYARY